MHFSWVVYLFFAVVLVLTNVVGMYNWPKGLYPLIGLCFVMLCDGILTLYIQSYHNRRENE